jgi:hypothetical protein
MSGQQIEESLEFKFISKKVVRCTECTEKDELLSYESSMDDLLKMVAVNGHEHITVYIDVDKPQQLLDFCSSLSKSLSELNAEHRHGTIMIGYLKDGKDIGLRFIYNIKP